MDMKGEHRIPASREAVWAALNDPDVLKASIPGCQDLTKTSDTGFDATVQAKVGPVKAKFSGSVTLSDIDPPNGYTISGEGKGGAAGFAKGGAKVSLVEDNADTILQYEVDAKVGGKLAQIGSRLIDSTAKKMAGEFFNAFADQVIARSTNQSEQTETPSSSQPIATSEQESETKTPFAGSIETSDDSPSTTYKVADNTQTVTAEATTSAINAVDETAKKRAFLSPYVWTLAIIVISGLLIYGFSE